MGPEDEEDVETDDVDKGFLAPRPRPERCNAVLTLESDLVSASPPTIGREISS